MRPKGMDECVFGFLGQGLSFRPVDSLGLLIVMDLLR